MKKIIACILIIGIFSLSTLAFADNIENVVVTLGNDLTEGQKKQMLEFFNVGDDVRIVYVTNQEERIILEIILMKA